MMNQMEQGNVNNESSSVNYSSETVSSTEKTPEIKFTTNFGPNAIQTDSLSKDETKVRMVMEERLRRAENNDISSRQVGRKNKAAEGIHETLIYFLHY